MTSIYKYYIELKNRFLLVTVAWVSTLLVSYIYKEALLFLILKPSLSYSNESSMYFIFTDVTEVFSVYLKIIVFFGFHTIIIYTLYHLLIFFSLGLYKFEYEYLCFLFKMIGIVFICSIFVFNNILLPITWHFFLSFQSFSFLKSIDFYFESKIEEYLTFYLTSYYICVCYCQTFVLLIIFFEHIKADLVKIKQYRKVLYYSFVIISTLITPPDIISQISLSLSFIVIYEILLFNIILKTSIKTLKN